MIVAFWTAVLVFREVCQKRKEGKGVESSVTTVLIMVSLVILSGLQIFFSHT